MTFKEIAVYFGLISGTASLTYGAVMYVENTKKQTISQSVSAITPMIKSAVDSAVNPLIVAIDSMIEDNREIKTALANAAKRDTAINNNFNRYRLKQAQNAQEQLEIMRDIQNNLPLFTHSDLKKNNLCQQW